MKRICLCICVTLVAAACFVGSVSAQQYSVPPGTPEDVEATYNTAIEKRTAAILALLDLTDTAKATRVHDIIMSQYRTLRARDDAIDALLKLQGKEPNYANRASLLESQSKTLHKQFLAKLSAELTPEQIEVVKDKMTYNKVQVTYTAYCSIIPNLTDADKAEIMEKLQAAREEAVEGGSAGEKSAIFQKYKDQINDYLNAHGHDVAKAYKDWEAKQQAAVSKSLSEPEDQSPPSAKQ